MSAERFDVGTKAIIRRGARSLPVTVVRRTANRVFVVREDGEGSEIAFFQPKGTDWFQQVGSSRQITHTLFLEEA